MNRLRLKDIAEIIMGQSPEAEYVSTQKIGLPLLNGPAEFTNKYPIPVQYTSLTRKTSLENDILFCVRGSTTGRMNIANQIFAIGRGLAAIRHRKDSKLNPYVKALIEVNLKKLLGGTLGSVFPNITKDNLFDLECYVHDDTDQQKVASVLSAIDNKIDLNNRINAELEGMAKLIYDYWFVQFDFPISAAQAQAMGKPELEGKPYKSSGGEMVWNKELKREVPEGWKNGSLKDVLDFNYGKPLKKEVRSGKGYPVVGSGGIVGFHHEALVKGPGIVVGRKGTVGNITYLHSNFFPIDTAYYIKPKGDFEIHYFYFLLNTLGLNKMNSDSAVPGLNRERALGTEILVCDKKLIEKFNLIIGPSFKKFSLLIEENQKLSALRDWLLPMLMNGQVRVEGKYEVSDSSMPIAAEDQSSYRIKNS